jgi:hypothetical protein
VQDGVVRVFTFKRGLLSPIAHDLCLRCERFDVRVEDRKVLARFEARSLRVEGVMRQGRLDAGVLSPDQKREIAETVQREILDTARHAEIVFSGELEERGSMVSVDGRLLLRGVEQPLRVTVQRGGGRLRGDVELVPSRFRIAPYSALLGAIRLDDRVLVRFDLADPA